MANEKITTSAELKKQYALSLLNDPTLGLKPDAVIVLPAVITDGKGRMSLDESNAVYESENSQKGFGYIQLIQIADIYLAGYEISTTKYALQRGKVENLKAKYQPGQVLPGNIVLKESTELANPNNPEEGLKFETKAHVEANVPSMIDDKPIYQVRYWDRTGKETDTILQATNVEELREIREQAAASAKPNAGINAAAQRRTATTK